MKTIKLKIKNEVNLTKELKEFNSIVRFSFNRFQYWTLNEQWKQTLSGIEDWKSAFKEIKKSKLKYRFQLFENIQNAVFSKKYIQSHISKYIF